MLDHLGIAIASMIFGMVYGYYRGRRARLTSKDDVLVYTLGNQEFKIPLKHGGMHKPSRVFMASNEFGKDITPELKQWMGPNDNFHGLKITPKDIGHKSIEVILDTSESLKFYEDCPIIIPNRNQDFESLSGDANKKDD